MTGWSICNESYAAMSGGVCAICSERSDSKSVVRLTDRLSKTPLRGRLIFAPTTFAVAPNLAIETLSVRHSIPYLSFSARVRQRPSELLQKIMHANRA
jgi:hypothetical protein